MRCAWLWSSLTCLWICRRKEPIIAIGGGVCLDVAGLAANLYRRNTPLIKIPTTVMAAVDASIGIKTAVNFHGRKNKMGTYCPPLAVFIDKTFLKTLGDRHLSNGSAEILKMACIKDRELFELLEDHSKELIESHFQVCLHAFMSTSFQLQTDKGLSVTWCSIAVQLSQKCAVCPCIALHYNSWHIQVVLCIVSTRHAYIKPYLILLCRVRRHQLSWDGPSRVC